MHLYKIYDTIHSGNLATARSKHFWEFNRFLRSFNNRLCCADIQRAISLISNILMFPNRQSIVLNTVSFIRFEIGAHLPVDILASRDPRSPPFLRINNDREGSCGFSERFVWKKS